jgi:hypothetical protein
MRTPANRSIPSATAEPQLEMNQRCSSLSLSANAESDTFLSHRGQDATNGTSSAIIPPSDAFRALRPVRGL